MSGGLCGKNWSNFGLHVDTCAVCFPHRGNQCAWIQTLSNSSICFPSQEWHYQYFLLPALFPHLHKRESQMLLKMNGKSSHIWRNWPTKNVAMSSVIVIVSYRRQPITHSRSDNQDLNATINVYILVTSATPLTAFVHRTALVKSHLDKTSHATEVRKHLSESVKQLQSK